MNEEAGTKQSIWYGNVRRMNRDRLPRRVIEWMLAGKRLRGRPSTSRSWIEEIESWNYKVQPKFRGKTTAMAIGEWKATGIIVNGMMTMRTFGNHSKQEVLRHDII